MNWKLVSDQAGEPELVDWSRWPATHKVVEQLEEGSIANHDGTSGEDLRRGFSLLRELAEADESLVEVAPNVWRVEKTNLGREF